MALGNLVAAALAYSGSGGAAGTVSPAYPAGILATDDVILIVGQKPNTANGGGVTTPSGWTLRESLTGAGGYGTTLGADTGNTNLFVYTWDNPVAGQTGNLSVTLTDNNIAWAFIARIPTDNGIISFGSADGSRTTAPTSGTAYTVTLTNGATATNFASGDIAVWAMTIPTDVLNAAGFSAHTISATGTTFGTPTEINEAQSGTGSDIGGYAAWARATAGSSTAAPIVGATATGTVTNVRGPIVLLRIRETARPAITGTLAASETGSDAFSSTGDVVVKGSLAATETGPDTFAATGTVSFGDITGTLAATEVGSDTFTSTGDVLVEGSLTATETDSDAFAATGDIIVQGSLAATETGADIFAATGEVANQVTTGTMAAVEVGSDTFAATGDLVVSGSLAATESGSDAFAATGNTLVQGSLVAAEVGTDTFAATGVLPVQGSLAATETGSDTFAATGTVTDPGIVGTLAATEVGSDTLASTGKVLVIGDLDAAEEPDAFAATGSVLVDGSFAAQEVGSDIFVGSGDNVVGGIMTATEIGSDTLGRYVDDGYVDSGYVDFEIPGEVLVQGTVSASEIGSDIFAATGFATSITGTLAATETGSDTFQATGSAEEQIAGRARGAVFKPVFEVTLTAKNAPKVKSGTKVGRVATSSSTQFIVAPHQGVKGKSRNVRLFKGISVNPTLRGGNLQTNKVSVITGTTFSTSYLKGAKTRTSAPKVTVSTPTVVQFRRNKAVIGSSAVKVTTVLNPTDQEMLAIVMMMRAQKMRSINNIKRKV